MIDQLKPLPVSNSDITTILSNDFLYIDKTQFVYDMIKIPSKYFLSRPRRFGKSTLLSTLNEVFRGKKELFKEQWIYQSPWSWQEYPIIRLDFSVARSTSLEFFIKSSLKTIAIKYNIFDEKQYADEPYDIYFQNIILQLFYKYNETQVVILIDEYDKPILDAIDNMEEAKAKREILKGFYSVMKLMDANLRFVFLTGVTRFSKVGVFSGLNNLDDITMDSKFATACGITQKELELYCKGYIELLAKSEQLSYADCLLKMKKWYNGFRFSKGEISVYSPYSTLLLLQKQEFANYWFSSGNPSFLIKLLIKNRYYLPELDTTVDPLLFDSFDIDKLNIKVLLLQTGYLTLAPTTQNTTKQYHSLLRELDIAPPNYEIAVSLQVYILQYIYDNTSTISNSNRVLQNTLDTNNINGFKRLIQGLFAGIPYNWYINNDIAHYEGFYCSVFYSFLIGSGYDVITEDATNKGRIDITLIAQNNVYIFELKTTNKNHVTQDENTNTALEQIKSRNYAQKYQAGAYAKIYLIGAEFSEDERNLVDFTHECYK